MNQSMWFTSSTRVQNYRSATPSCCSSFLWKPSSIPLFQPPIRMWYVLLFLFYLPSDACFDTRGWVSFVKFRHGIFGRALKVFSSCNLHLLTSDYLYNSILNFILCVVVDWVVLICSFVEVSELWEGSESSWWRCSCRNFCCCICVHPSCVCTCI